MTNQKTTDKINNSMIELNFNSMIELLEPMVKDAMERKDVDQMKSLNDTIKNIVKYAQKETA